MTFRSLSLADWRQFERVEIEFHDRLTILTGANGSGKTTILNILGGHYNWNISLVSLPSRDKKTGTLKYLGDVLRRRNLRGSSADESDEVGKITYNNGRTARLLVPVKPGQQYHLAVLGQQTIPGLHIPSHRPVYTYQPVGSIPTRAMSRQEAYQEYFASGFQRYLGRHHEKAPNQVMKEALISLAVFGPGNAYVAPDETAQAILEGFQDVLRKVLPPKIGFERLSIRIPEVVLETASGPFSLDAVSGGLASILDISWRIFMYSPNRERFVCTIDEPENHLHPELQQSLLPNLVDAFPKVQFIVATHNPFMISAVYDSTVYVLDYNTEQRVVSQELDRVNKAGTANEILRDVLGLPFTMPLWAERKLDTIVRKYAETGIDEGTVDQLETELVEAGLGNLVLDTTSSDSSEQHDE